MAGADRQSWRNELKKASIALARHPAAFIQLAIDAHESVLGAEEAHIARQMYVNVLVDHLAPIALIAAQNNLVSAALMTLLAHEAQCSAPKSKAAAGKIV